MITSRFTLINLLKSSSNVSFMGLQLCCSKRFSLDLNNLYSCLDVKKATNNNHAASYCTKHNIVQALEKFRLDDANLTKVLKIALIGTPNTGKSTFINQIVGRRVFAVSKKVHTTRERARAVINLDDTQVIFLDTPGLVSQGESDKYNLESTFLRDGEMSMVEANIVAVMHDASNSYTRGRLDPKVLRLLHLYPRKHTVLILNKVDTVKKKRYLLELVDRLSCHTLKEINSPSDTKTPSEDEVKQLIKTQTGWPNFHQVFMVSSIDGSGVSEVMEYLLQFAKLGKWMFPDTVFTDLKPEQLICNSVKARLLEHLPDEVPYRCNVQIELLNKLEDGTVMAVVLITCPKLRIEKMVLKKIRTIAQLTEADLRGTFLGQVLVKLVLQTDDNT